MGKKLQKLCPRGCNLLTAQDLWQAHYQILLIILLKEFIKTNVQFLNASSPKDDLIE